MPSKLWESLWCAVSEQDVNAATAALAGHVVKTSGERDDDLEAKSKDGDTLLIAAVGSPAMVSLLLDHGADINGTSSNISYTALHTAVEKVFGHRHLAVE